MCRVWADNCEYKLGLWIRWRAGATSSLASRPVPPETSQSSTWCHWLLKAPRTIGRRGYRSRPRLEGRRSAWQRAQVSEQVSGSIIYVSRKRWHRKSCSRFNMQTFRSLHAQVGCSILCKRWSWLTLRKVKTSCSSFPFTSPFSNNGKFGTNPLPGLTCLQYGNGACYQWTKHFAVWQLPQIQHKPSKTT